MAYPCPTCLTRDATMTLCTEGQGACRRCGDKPENVLTKAEVRSVIRSRLDPETLRTLFAGRLG